MRFILYCLLRLKIVLLPHDYNCIIIITSVRSAEKVISGRNAIHQISRKIQLTFDDTDYFLLEEAMTKCKVEWPKEVGILARQSSSKRTKLESQPTPVSTEGGFQSSGFSEDGIWMSLSPGDALRLFSSSQFSPLTEMVVLGTRQAIQQTSPHSLFCWKPSWALVA